MDIQNLTAAELATLAAAIASAQAEQTERETVGNVVRARINDAANEFAALVNGANEHYAMKFDAGAMLADKLTRVAPASADAVAPVPAPTSAGSGRGKGHRQTYHNATPENVQCGDWTSFDGGRGRAPVTGTVRIRRTSAGAFTFTPTTGETGRTYNAPGPAVRASLDYSAGRSRSAGTGGSLNGWEHLTRDGVILSDAAGRVPVTN